jgi:putative ABC transport system substrate-binding protein
MVGRWLFIVVAILLFVVGGTRPSLSAHKLIGVVLSGELPRYRDAHRAFMKTMAAKGFEPGAVEFVVQAPNPDPGSWANAARKMKALGAQVVIAYGAPAAQAVTREADNIPLVFVDVFGPQETGIIKGMFGDGGQVTGITSKVPLVTIVKTAQDLKPLKTLGVIYNSREAGSLVQLQELQRLAGRLGFAVKEAQAATAGGVDAALSILLHQVDFIYVAESVAAGKQFDRIITRATTAKVPVLSSMPGASERGALVALEINPAEQGQLAAEYVSRILAGISSGQLPVRVPRQIDLIINLKTAKALDILVPFQVLSVATRVVK